MKFGLFLLISIISAIHVYGQSSNSLETKNDGSTIIPARPRVNPLLYVISEENKTFTYSDRNYTNPSNINDILGKINQSWINSITVLKDKSATNVYGSMGQHGVIIINVKHGSLDKMPDEIIEKFKVR